MTDNDLLSVDYEGFAVKLIFAKHAINGTLRLRFVIDEGLAQGNHIISLQLVSVHYAKTTDSVGYKCVVAIDFVLLPPGCIKDGEPMMYCELSMSSCPYPLRW